jgi:cysteine desulfuration protein SufE
MADIPQALADVIADFQSIADRRERQEMLIETADRFDDSARVTPDVAMKPYPDEHKVPACESEAFVWSVENPDGTLKYYFDVLNPQGLSAMAMSVILDETCSGAPPEQVMQVPMDIVFQIFGNELSMGKGIGVMGIVAMVVAAAKQQAEKNKQRG